MNSVFQAIISLWKMTFQKFKFRLFIILLIVFFYNYFIDVKYSGGSLDLKLVQPKNGFGELIVIVILFIVLVWVDFVLINSRSKRSIDVIKDPNVSDDIKKILAEDYKNNR